jgi:3-methyladenine DNA glycosylase AlkD
MPWGEPLIRDIKRAFIPLADHHRAAGAFAYMKGIAPFLGIDTPTRRATLKPIFKALPVPTSKQLGEAARALMKLPQREYHYAAYDLLAHFIDAADKDFLATYGEELLSTVPWWDTVDGLGNAMVSPLAAKYPSRTLIKRWINSDNIWLVRAAIQHQRGWRSDTEIDYVLSLCDQHSDSREFFIAKAIGWALRDISRMNKTAVRNFLRDHPELSKVAVREAERGLGR